MSRAGAACLGWMLALAISGCGKYGPPVRRAPGTDPDVSAERPVAGVAVRNEDREESKK